MAKRRGRGEGTIFQRADGRWTGEVSLGYRAGQRTRKQVYGPTRAEVSRKLTAILSTQQRGLPVIGDRLTVGRFLEDWLNKIVSPRTRPSTFESYKGLVEQHLGPALGGIRPRGSLLSTCRSSWPSGWRPGCHDERLRIAELCCAAL